MIEGGIENGLLLRVRGLDLNLAQFLVPGGAGIGLHGLKIPAREFCGHVGLGAFNGDGREGHLYQHLLSGSGVSQLEAAVERLAGLAALTVIVGVFRHGEVFGGAGERGPEEDFLVFGPAGGIAVTADGNDGAAITALHLKAGIRHIVPAAAVFQVKKDGGILRLREGIAVQAHAGSGREFGKDVVPQQRNAVITGFRHFFASACIAPGAGSRIGLNAPLGPGGAHNRHHGNVKEVADAGAAQVRMAEADDGRVTVMVAGAPVPRLGDAGGSQLHESERHPCPHKHVAMASGADFRVHISGIVLRLRCAACGQKTGGRRQKDFFHTISFSYQR